MRLLNLVLGTTVAVVGFWLIWDAVSPFVALGWAMTVGLFLWWKTKSITEIWAWSTLFLGLESFAWPLALMIRFKGRSDSLPETEMGTILSAVVLGLFSSVFWISFAYGLFNRAWKIGASSSDLKSTTVGRGRGTKKQRA